MKEKRLMARKHMKICSTSLKGRILIKTTSILLPPDWQKCRSLAIASVEKNVYRTIRIPIYCWLRVNHTGRKTICHYLIK